MKPQVADLATRLVTGDRAALSRAITLVESTLPEDRQQGSLLLMRVLETINARKEKLKAGKLTDMPKHVSVTEGERRSFTPNGALRIGISGPPGVGKSTFIESFGMYLAAKAGQRVAVLTIDPSSARTGGSILGDKTRMNELSKHPHAYVRPSPSRGTLGGVAQDTAEAAILCEAAGYDVIIIETVGVGQSEVTVNEMVDMLVLLVAPAGGDELQGIKKGIVELANMIVVTKADGALLSTARATRSDYAHASHLIFRQEGEWVPQVLMCSSLDPEQKQVAKIWKGILEYEKFQTENGQLEQRRLSQRIDWAWRQLAEEVPGFLAFWLLSFVCCFLAPV